MTSSEEEYKLRDFYLEMDRSIDELLWELEEQAEEYYANHPREK